MDIKYRVQKEGKIKKEKPKVENSLSQHKSWVISFQKGKVCCSPIDKINQKKKKKMFTKTLFHCVYKVEGSFPI